MTNFHKDSNFLKAFMMQNLMLEHALLKLEASGIEIGHKKTLTVKKDSVDLENFESDILREASQMSEFYKVYYSLENSIRSFIRERLLENHGENWWKSKVPEDIKAEVNRKQNLERDTSMSIRSDDPLDYINFSELAKIITSNWIDFSDTLRSKKAVITTLSGFGKIRNVIAHSCYLREDEALRLKLAVKDWFRIHSQEEKNS